MDCQKAKEQILGMGDVDAELKANPELAAHIATCPDCQLLVGMVRKMDAAAAALPLPEGYARVPVAFLKRVENEMVLPRKKGCLGKLVRRAIAAGLIITVGVMAVSLLMFNGSQARADVVLGQLVQWNLDIAGATPAERAKIYAAHAAEMQAQANHLSAVDRSLADELLDNAKWLTTESDEKAETQAFAKIADQLKSRAATMSDPAASTHLNQVYLQMLHDGVEKHAPLTVPPATNIHTLNIQNDVGSTVIGAAPQNAAQQGVNQPRNLLRRFSTSGGGSYVLTTPRISHDSGANSAAPLPTSISTSHNWTTTNTFSGRGTTDFYASSSGGSGSSGGSHGSSGSNGNAHSGGPSSVASRGGDANQNASDGSTDSNDGPVSSDTPPPPRHSGMPMPFSDPNMPTSKLATGECIPGNGGSFVPGIMPSKSMPGYDGGSSKSAVYHPSSRKSTAADGDQSSMTPVISSPSSDRMSSGLGTATGGKDDSCDDPLSLGKTDDGFSKDGAVDCGSVIDDSSGKIACDPTWQKADNESADDAGDVLPMKHGKFGAIMSDSGAAIMTRGSVMVASVQGSPEPSSAVLLVIGGLTLLRRRRPLSR